MPAKRIAAAILQRPDGKILLLKRSPEHTTNAGKWCFVTGYIEEGEEPEAAAIRELEEELSICARPVQAGGLVVVETDWGGTLHVFPYLFNTEIIDIQLEGEHTNYTWIHPHEIYQYDVVQQLDEDLIALNLLK
nr:NUDIX domain-containing protein [Anaerolineae bacterium]